MFPRSTEFGAELERSPPVLVKHSLRNGAGCPYVWTEAPGLAEFGKEWSTPLLSFGLAVGASYRRTLSRLRRQEYSDPCSVRLYMKTRMVILLLVVAATVTFTGTVLAAYMIGEFGNSLSTSTHVVDANVTTITKERYARLEVRRHFKGTNAPTLITGTALSCTHEPPGAFRMQPGKRYIIMLRDAAFSRRPLSSR